MTTDTTHRTEAARRTAAASGDGALALLEACRENVALRRELAEARAVYEAKWTALPGDTLADMMRALVSEVRSQQAAARARGRRVEALEGAIRHNHDRPHRYDPAGCDFCRTYSTALRPASPDGRGGDDDVSPI